MASAAARDAKIDIGRVITGGFQAIGRRLPAYLLLAVLLGGVPAFLSQYALLSTDGVDDGPALWFLSAGGLAGMVIAMIASALLQAAVVRCAIRDLGGRSCDVAESFVAALKLVLPLIGLTILSGLIVGLGLLLLIVPGIIFYVSLIVAVPVLVEERCGVIDSMKRSADLTSGSRWRIFGLIILYILAYGFLASAVGAAALAMGALEDLLSLALLEAVAGTLSALLIAGMLAALYVELRTVKEGASVESLASVFD
ncbi:MAG: YciC family protein [Allosphingosinicella sp.]